MYLRPVFTETNQARILALIEANSFGVIVTQGAAGPEATHLPFIVQRDGDGFVLAGHFAAANPQCAAIGGGTALAVFSGPHAYIAPGWYKTQPAVPTWDYAAVHVTGVLEAELSPDAMLNTMAAHDPVGFNMRMLTDQYRAAMLKGIRSFVLRPVKVEAQWKMSQNRSIEDRNAVIAALRAEGNDAVADLIAQTIVD